MTTLEKHPAIMSELASHILSDWASSNNVENLFPRRETIDAMLYALATARLRFPKNENVFNSLDDAMELWKSERDAYIHDDMRKRAGLLCRGSNMEFAASCITVAIMAIRAMEEGDALLPSYTMPSPDDLNDLREHP